MTPWLVFPVIFHMLVPMPVEIGWVCCHIFLKFHSKSITVAFKLCESSSMTVMLNLSTSIEEFMKRMELFVNRQYHERIVNDFC